MGHFSCNEWHSLSLSFIGSKSSSCSSLTGLHGPLVIRLEMLLLQRILSPSLLVLLQLLMLVLFLLLGLGGFLYIINLQGGAGGVIHGLVDFDLDVPSF